MTARKLQNSFLLLAILASAGLAQDDGTWLDYGSAEAEFDTLLTPLEQESFVAATPDSGPADSSRADLYSQFYLFEDIFLPPALEFSSWSLQDALRDNLLAEEENVRLNEVFRADSSLALSIFQLRGEEFPHYHLLSDLWVYIWRGRGELRLDDVEIEFGPGHFLQIPSGSLYSFKNIRGAPTVGLIWARPPLVDSLTVEIIPEEILARMLADSLRAIDLQERSLYRRP
jgi:mannose-6-phosphate isomerase-like protein (cupin superfamily)